MSIRLAVDLLGGDAGTLPILAAAGQALRQFPRLELLLIGPAHLEAEWRSSLPLEAISRYQWQPCDRAIRMSDSLFDILRPYDPSSMQLSLLALAEQQVQAVVSAGNTLALFALARRHLPRLPGTHRPALVAQLPGPLGKTLLLDCGGWLTADSKRLVELAMLAQALLDCQYGQGKAIGLLNVGQEQQKGEPRLRKAYELLQQRLGARFAGFVEGYQLFSGEVGAVVTDGFSGNLVLKSVEGLARMLKQSLSPLAGAAGLQQICSKLDTDNYNGALLAGVAGIVIKSHGAANQQAFYQSMLQALDAAQAQLNQKLAAQLLSLHRV